MTARKKMVAGNWKMNGSLAGNQELIEGFLPEVTDAVDVAVFVPAPYLSQVQALCSGTSVRWGAQDVSSMPNGAFTGEISLPMLLEFGVTHVLVGHSERRTYHAESSVTVAAKAQAAIQASVLPIVCVGETLQEREAGRVIEVIHAQLDPVFERCGVFAKDGVWPLMIAYEPVWAIGTGVTASPEQAQEVHAAIRSCIQDKLGAEVAQKTRILYGGSVKPGNAAEIFTKNDIDGGLIGGAALSSSDFSGIIRAARG